MSTKDYQREVSRWNNWLWEVEKYQDTKIKLIQENAPKRVLEKLEKYRPSLTGPFTFIADPFDLVNPNFILPGKNSSFRDLSNIDHEIPMYYGKRIYSEAEHTIGIMIGFGYDASDNYIRIRDYNGIKFDILVNTGYCLLES